MAGKISDITTTETAPANVLWVEGEKTDGSSIKVAPKYVGGLVLLSKTTTSASAGNVTFSSIPAGFTDLIVIVNGRCSKAAANDDLYVQLNADTGANYDLETMLTNNATFNGSNAIAQTQWNLGWLPGTSATSGISASTEILIPNYSGTTFQKTMRTHSGLNQTNVATGMYVKEVHGWYRSTSAVSSVKVYPATSNFIDGSVVALYGRG